MPSPVELIKERLNIAEVIGSCITLEKSGANLKAKCPFHNERTPSFFISPARGSYYCFGCGAKGDIFSFVQAFEGLDFYGALQVLATRAGVPIVREDPRERSERERLFLLLETATLFFQRELGGQNAAREYLLKRGLTAETIQSWRLGFAVDAWRNCFEYCKGKGFSTQEIEKAGLIKSEGVKTYDRFRSRIMFPIFDSAGRVVAFSGRIFGEEREGIPKYLNSPETPIFSKSRVLYGFDRAKTEIRRLNYAILVEGQMDLLMCHQAGFGNAVASSGTAFTQEQLTIIQRLSNRLLMVYDADSAGVRASLRSASLALAEGMEVKVVALPKGTDPADLIRDNPVEWKKCLSSSTHIIDFYLEEILQEKLEARALVRAIRDRLLPYLAVLESTIERDHFISTISKRTGIREMAIREDLAKVPTNEARVSISEESKTVLAPRRDLAARLLVGLILWQRGLEHPALDVRVLEADMARIMGEDRRKKVFSEMEPETSELVYQAESYYREGSLEEGSRDLLATLEEDTLLEDLSVAMRELTDAEHKKDKPTSEKLLTTCHELTTRLNAVRARRNSLKNN